MPPKKPTRGVASAGNYIDRQVRTEGCQTVYATRQILQRGPVEPAPAAAEKPMTPTKPDKDS